MHGRTRCEGGGYERANPGRCELFALGLIERALTLVYILPRVCGRSVAAPPIAHPHYKNTRSSIYISCHTATNVPGIVCINGKSPPSPPHRQNSHMASKAPHRQNKFKRRLRHELSNIAPQQYIHITCFYISRQYTQEEASLLQATKQARATKTRPVRPPSHPR